METGMRHAIKTKGAHWISKKRGRASRQFATRKTSSSNRTPTINFAYSFKFPGRNILYRDSIETQLFHLCDKEFPQGIKLCTKTIRIIFATSSFNGFEHPSLRSIHGNRLITILTKKSQQCSHVSSHLSTNFKTERPNQFRCRCWPKNPFSIPPFKAHQTKWGLKIEPQGFFHDQFF